MLGGADGGRFSWGEQTLTIFWGVFFEAISDRADLGRFLDDGASSELNQTSKGVSFFLLSRYSRTLVKNHLCTKNELK